MALDDFLANGESYTRATAIFLAPVQALKNAEYLVEIFLFDAYAIVANGKKPKIAAFFDGYDDTAGAFRRAIFNGVGDEILKQTNQLFLTSMHGRHAVWNGNLRAAIGYRHAEIG